MSTRTKIEGYYCCENPDVYMVENLYWKNDYYFCHNCGTRAEGEKEFRKAAYKNFKESTVRYTMVHREDVEQCCYCPTVVATEFKSGNVIYKCITCGISAKGLTAFNEEASVQLASLLGNYEHYEEDQDEQ